MKSRLLFLFAFCILATLSGKCQPAPPGAPAVVITEIMYHSPQAGMDDLEFIELRNPSDTAERSLSFHSFTEGIEFTFPTGVLVQPKEYVIVAKDSAAFENTFGIPAFQWTSGDLDDAGETIILKGNFNNVVDSVAYSASSPWPLGADGNGSSIVLCNDTLPNGGPAHWEAAATSTGIVVNSVAVFANPGADCSIANGLSEFDMSDMTVIPNPNNGTFSLVAPFAQGAEDYTLNIHGLKGELLHSELLTLGSQEKITVQGSLPAGIYMLSLRSKDALFRQRLVIMK